MLWKRRRASPAAARRATARAARFWSERQREDPGIVSWWQNPQVVAHVNQRICGRPVPGPSGGDVALLSDHFGAEPAKRAISVGCGTAIKEVALLEAGVVEYFELYEIAEERIAFASDLVKQRGLEQRVTIRREVIDFAQPCEPVDLVYWNSSLHHMLDTTAAIEWSRRSLSEGGTLFMNDFVGPNRMQWDDAMLGAANDARSALPGRIFEHAGRATQPREVGRPTVKEMIAKDPTECADSASILPQLSRVFPEAEVKLTGGVVYHLALHGLYGSFTDSDGQLLAELLARDDELAEAGMTHFAVALARI